MEYNFREIEQRWQAEWKKNKTYRTENSSDKPKYYVLDMFPYPSGAGLHVGHPLGYIASDIVARYKRLCGYNVLHPMGYDAFGLPAEQYAIQTGRHPADTTKENIARYREQLDKIGFSFDWDREVQTCDPKYYKWTQWIFIQLFKSWYNCKTKKAEPIDTLIAVFEKEGFKGELHRVLTGDIEHDLTAFTPEQWKNFSEKEKSDVLMNFRLAYLGEAWVNWCPQLGTVLANDEVKDGVSERGGYPVERKRMPQWSMRITAYADRLLNDLNELEWSDSIKEAQRNWIGRSEGSSITFRIPDSEFRIEVFTTRPDTIFGVTFVTLAPEHELVHQVTTPEYKAAVEAYVNVAKNKSERERQAEKKVSGQFTGAYVIHPFTNEKIPVYIGEYVLAGYGTGAVMAVPAHDSRDHAFAKHFNLPIVQVVAPLADFGSPLSDFGSAQSDKDSAQSNFGYAQSDKDSAQSTFGSAQSDKTFTSSVDVQTESYDAKEGKCINSDFLNGLEVKDAVRRAIEEIEKRGIGKGKVNFRLRDAAFGRQRYWGEPIPVYYKTDPSSTSTALSMTTDLIPETMDESDLPLILPEIDKFLPTESGEPPLARAKNWVYSPSAQAQDGGFGAHSTHASPQPLSRGEGHDLDENLEGLVVAEMIQPYKTANKAIWNTLKDRAREHRKEQTPTEAALWQAIRGSKLGHKIRRQHAIDIFIADFICIRKGIIIEVDGGYHLSPEQQQYDEQRTFVLEQSGFRVMRFTNEQVLQNISDVVNQIKASLDSTPDVLPYTSFNESRSGGTLSSGDQGEARVGAGEKGQERYPLETTTMPGWAGSSWYFLRYMDPHNDKELVGRKIADYWGNVDLYLGGAEHATGHLLYVRFWTKFLYDIRKIPVNEPAKKLVNQGMIQGVSAKIARYRLGREQAADFSQITLSNDGKCFNVKFPHVPQSIFVSIDALHLLEGTDATVSYSNVDISWTEDGTLDVAKFLKNTREDQYSAFITRNGIWQHGTFTKFVFGGDEKEQFFTVVAGKDYSLNGAISTREEVEKMSKSKLNVVTPDLICEHYGADTLRLYEMFLGPLEQHKPWSTNGISGTSNFLKRFWRLFVKDDAIHVSSDEPTEAELKVLHRTLKKVSDDIERMSFNTSVSQFMIAVNELYDLKCSKRSVLEPLVIALSPFAPHIAEELWQHLGHTESVTKATFPKIEEKYLVDNTVNYPVQFNGKMRFTIALAADLSNADVEKEVLSSTEAQKYLEGKTPKKVIVVPRKIVNVVL